MERQEREEAIRSRKRKREGEEVRAANAAFEAARYRDWERWVVLHEPPSEGAVSRTRQGQAFTVVEASVEQQGKPMAKKARWSLPLRQGESFTLRFEVGPLGANSGAQVPRGHDRQGGGATAVRPEAGEGPVRGAVRQADYGRVGRGAKGPVREDARAGDHGGSGRAVQGDSYNTQTTEVGEGGEDGPQLSEMMKGVCWRVKKWIGPTFEGLSTATCESGPCNQANPLQCTFAHGDVDKRGCKKKSWPPISQELDLNLSPPMRLHMFHAGEALFLRSPTIASGLRLAAKR